MAKKKAAEPKAAAPKEPKSKGKDAGERTDVAALAAKVHEQFQEQGPPAGVAAAPAGLAGYDWKNLSLEVIEAILRVALEHLGRQPS